MFINSKTVKRYFSLVELMVVIGLFSFFIVILTQFLLKATELWRYTENETELNVKSQQIFATIDNLLDEAVIPATIPKADDAAKGFAITLQNERGTGSPISSATASQTYALSPQDYEYDPENPKTTNDIYDDVGMIIFPTVSDMRIGRSENSNFYIVAIARNAKDQLVVRTIGDKSFPNSSDYTNLMGKKRHELLNIFRNSGNFDFSENSSNTGYLTQVLADNVTMFNVFPLVNIGMATGANVSNIFGVIPVSPNPNDFPASSGSGSGSSVDFNTLDIVGFQFEIALLSKNDYDTWLSMWPQRNSGSGNNTEPAAARNFRTLHERVFTRIISVR